MEKTIKIVAITLGVLALIVFIPFVCLRYTTRYKEKLVDKTSSPDKQYILSMYSVGEPYWPFGGAPGRLILEMANSKVARAEFEIANDGARFDEDSWDVTWCSDRVEVVLSGNEQYDELVTMYFDGGAERKRLTTIRKQAAATTTETARTDTETTGGEIPGNNSEEMPDDVSITAGYKAVYDLYNDDNRTEFDVTYGASERSSRCVLNENTGMIDYIVYNGKSPNGKCCIYVRYKVDASADETVSYDEGHMVDIYAYVLETKKVVSSGKKQWEDTGSDEFIDVTEK